MAYTLAEPFLNELEYLQQIIVSLWLDETSGWCNSFVLVPKPNACVHLFLDPARLNLAFIRLVYMDQTIKDIFPRLTNKCYITLIDTSSGYHILKLDNTSSCLTTVACQFSRYRHLRLPSVQLQLVTFSFAKQMRSSKNYPVNLVLLMTFYW